MFRAHRWLLLCCASGALQAAACSHPGRDDIETVTSDACHAVIGSMSDAAARDHDAGIERVDAAAGAQGPGLEAGVATQDAALGLDAAMAQARSSLVDHR